MVNFKVLISSVKAGCKRPLIMDPHFFSSFSNTSHVVWSPVFVLQTFFYFIIVFRYCIATVILLFKSITKYCKFIFLKLNEVPYLQAQVFGKKKSSGGEGKVPMTPLNNFSNFFFFFFFKKNSNFCEITQLDFQSNLKK